MLRMLKINLMPQGTLAIYEQIVNQMKSAIVSGEMKAGEALPSIRSLAADLAVSVITTKRAYEELEKEGLIRSVAGKGFYVCEYNTDYLMEKQLMMIEKRLGEIIFEVKNAGISKEDFLEMAETLYDTNTEGKK
jgi:GntR family transcriptional regulator